MTSPAASSLALPILDAELEQRLRARMVEVEEELEAAIQSEAAFVTEAARHLMDEVFQGKFLKRHVEAFLDTQRVGSLVR